MKIAGIEVGKVRSSARGVATMLASAKRLDELANELGIHLESGGNVDAKEFKAQLDEFRLLRKSTKGVSGLADIPQGRALIDLLSAIERKLTDELPVSVVAGSKKALPDAVQILTLRAQIHGIEKLSASHKTTVERAMSLLRRWKPKGENNE